MRILSPQVGGLSPKTILGGHVYDREMLKALAQLGAEIEVIVPARAQVVDWPGIVVTRTRLARGFRWPVSNLVFAKYIKAAWQRNAFDVLRVHSPCFTGLGCLYARHSWNLPVPIIVHHHQLEGNWMARAIVKRVVQSCDMIITASEFSLRQLIYGLDIDSDNVKVVYHGVSREFGPGLKDLRLAGRLGIDVRRPVLLYVGSLIKRKNVIDLLRMMRHLVCARAGWRGSNPQLVIAGAGPEERMLKRETSLKGLEEWVRFLGPVTGADEVGLYNLCDIFVTSTKLEGFGLAVAEAMACGKPVVATDVGALSEVMGKRAGILVPPGRPRLMADAVTQLVWDEPLAKGMGEAGRQRVEKMFRWDVAARKTFELYQQAMRNKVIWGEDT